MKSIFNIFYLSIALILSIEIEGINSALEKKYLNSCEDISLVDDFMPILDVLILEIKLPSLLHNPLHTNLIYCKAFLYKEFYSSSPTLDSLFTPPENNFIYFAYKF